MIKIDHTSYSNSMLLKLYCTVDRQKSSWDYFNKKLVIFLFASYFCHTILSLIDRDSEFWNLVNRFYNKKWISYNWIKALISDETKLNIFGLKKSCDLVLQEGSNRQAHQGEEGHLADGHPRGTVAAIFLAVASFEWANILTLVFVHGRASSSKSGYGWKIRSN